MLGAIILLRLCVCVVSGPSGRYERQTADDIKEDAVLKVPELVRKYGYPLEEHQITTRDGYILTMHRIPYSRGLNQTTDRPVVFIMHGLMSSSADFVLMGPNKSLGYILAEEGFDVWLGNARGNRYSRRHVSLNPDSETEFWNFSWDEIGNIDVPAMIDHALNMTNKNNLHYIGHSQGTTTFFVMCSLRPEYNQKIISMNALAPVVYNSYSTHPLIRPIAPFSNVLETLSRQMGIKGEMLPLSNSVVMRWAGEKFCSDQAVTRVICNNIVFLSGGWVSLEFNKTMLPVILSHSPAGGSIRQVVHYGQVSHTNEFRRFNHEQWNTKIYGTTEPPLYKLRQVSAPVFLRYSLGDELTHVKDVERLSNELGNVKAKIIIPLSTFTHLDFIYGIHVRKLVYDQMIADMKKMQNKKS